MNLDDIKDRLLSESRAFAERVQESSFYNNLRDRYENLPPAGQKASLILGSCIIGLTVLSFPYGYYTSSKDYEQQFIEKRQVIRNLLQVTREAQEGPNLPIPPSLDSLKLTIDSKLKSQNLIPEQMRGIDSVESSSSLVSGGLAKGALKVNLAKLNLRQIVDILADIQSISPSVKAVDLKIEANSSDTRYFDMMVKLVSLNVPDMTPTPPPAEPEQPKKSFKKKKATGSEE